jgi:hypothetical protein
MVLAGGNPRHRKRESDVGGMFDTWPELRCWQRVCMPEKRPTRGVKCVAYWLAQLSSQLRLDLQGAFTTSKPPTLNRSRARLSNSLVRPDRYGLKRQTPATIGAAVGLQ